MTTPSGEEEYMSKIHPLLSRKDILFDIGAFIGIYGISLGWFVKHTFLIEPSPLILKTLAKNLLLNPGLKFTVVPAACGERLENKPLHIFGETNTPCPSFANTELGSKQLSVQIIPIDLLAVKYRTTPTVVKVDTEGWEEFVLRGAAKSLPHIHTWAIECHEEISLKNWGYSAYEKISPFMKKAGYTEIYHFPRGTTTILTIWTKQN